MKTHASKATPEEIAEHIRRQREHGESMINDDDQPTGIEFAATGLIILAAISSYWWFT